MRRFVEPHSRGHLAAALVTARQNGWLEVRMPWLVGLHVNVQSHQGCSSNPAPSAVRLHASVGQGPGGVAAPGRLRFVSVTASVCVGCEAPAACVYQLVPKCPLVKYAS